MKTPLARQTTILPILTRLGVAYDLNLTDYRQKSLKFGVQCHHGELLPSCGLGICSNWFNSSFDSKLDVIVDLVTLTGRIMTTTLNMDEHPQSNSYHLDALCILIPGIIPHAAVCREYFQQNQTGILVYEHRNHNTGGIHLSCVE